MIYKIFKLKRYSQTVLPWIATCAFLMLINTILLAQFSFERVTLPEPASQLKANFRGLYDGDTKFADLNGDGFDDLITTGLNTNNFPLKTAVYWNDGNGNFTPEENLGALQASGGFSASIATADFNGDGHIDILLTGSVRSLSFGNFSYHTELYSNNGLGQFTLLDDTTFVGLSEGGVVVFDIENDGDIDILIYGKNTSLQSQTALYRNLGNGIFAEDTDTGIVNSRMSTAASADVDGDGDEDFVLSGANTAGQPHTILYLNNGEGSFTQQPAGPFIPVHSGAALFADFNGDGLPELVLTGNTSSFQRTTRMYVNTGNGNFTVSPGVFLNVANGSDLAAADIDSDGDADLIVAGFPIPGPGKGRIYLNNGSGQFGLAAVQPLFDLEETNLAISDADADGDPDILHMGKLQLGGSAYTSLWLNDGGLLSLGSQSPFEGNFEGHCALEDTDDGGVLDIFSCGLNALATNNGYKHQNTGGGGFGSSTVLPFGAVQFGEFAFADVDGDGDPDVLATGQLSNATRSTKLYINNGSGQYAEAGAIPFPALTYSSVAFGDADGDGDQDVLLCGELSSGSFITRLYLNDGLGNYTQSPASFPGLSRADLAFGDFDNDGDLDIIMGGRFKPSVGNIQFISRIYLNNGTGSFSWLSNSGLDGMDEGNIALGDADGDGDLDIAICSAMIQGIGKLKLYFNNDSAIFSDSGLFEDVIVYYGTVDFADMDGDGDLDLFLTGQKAYDQNFHWATLFANNGTGNFVIQENLAFEGISDGAVAIADVDGVGDQDLLYSGKATIGHPVTYLYLNNSQPTCEVSGGILSSTSQLLNLCKGDGHPNEIQVSVNGNQNLGLFGLVRASNQSIAGVSVNGYFDMEDYPAGNYFIGHLSYSSAQQLEGVTQVNQLQGCFELSNTLAVTTIALNGGSISPQAATTVCGNDGMASVIPFSVQGAQGPNLKWVVLNNNYTEIVAIANNPTFNFDNFGEGIYRVAHIAFANGVNIGDVNLPEIPSCLDASNFVKITVINCPGITILETYPNPVMSEAQVLFIPSESGEVLIEILDIAGRRIAILYQDYAEAAKNNYFNFQTAHLTPGIYFVRMTQNGNHTTRKIIR